MAKAPAKPPRPPRFVQIINDENSGLVALDEIGDVWYRENGHLYEDPTAWKRLALPHEPPLEEA